MIKAIAVTSIAILFFAVLFVSGALFRRRQIDMDGTPPIDRRLFFPSKYSIALVWLGMIVSAWGLNYSISERPGWLRGVALCLWFLGFGVLLAGGFDLGGAFRIGSAKEKTRLKTNGLFGVSRNPMYLGVYATVVAAILYTLNPVLLVLGAFSIAVHHRIILAEEEHLRRAFGDEYQEYCRNVRRYL